MKVVIDLDQHAAVQAVGIADSATSFSFKSQDTVDWLIYFVRGGVVQDLGSGMALKIGMIKTGDTTNTLLAYQTAFTYNTDSDGNKYYATQVNYNTSQMASAITGLTQLPCTTEVRYQTADNEIIHSLNIACMVYPTILVETGVTPPGVSTGYPDASAIELLVHKNAASGYAGLNASGKLGAPQIPVDGKTIAMDGSGNIALFSILARTTASFVTPASGATVSVTFDGTGYLAVGSYIRIPPAGYYIVNSITSGTVAVLQNNGDPFNAASGTTIPSGSVALPAQAAAGGAGSPGQNAYSTTTANFSVPAVGATVSVTMTATSWLAGSGYVVFVQSAGYYAVSSVTDSTHAILTNLGYANTNASPGTVINSGAKISPGALQGPASSATGANAYDTTQASFTMPAAATSVNVTITNTGWLGVGQEVYISSAGYFSVASIISPTVFSASNSNYPGAATPGSTIASGAKVSPAGVIGPTGAGGSGLNAFTTLTSGFTQPAINATVAIVVGTTAWMVAGQTIYIAGGGYYSVAIITDLTHVTVANLGYSGNAAPGATVTGSGTQGVSPGGVIGSTGAGAYTSTSASFVMPAALQTVSLTVVSSAALLQNQNIYIGTAGYFSVSSVVDATHILAINLGSPGNVSSGTTIASGVGITPAGATGPAINTSGGFSTAADAIAPAGAGEISHIASQTGGVLALKKLKAGSANITLTDQGGTTGDIIIDSPGGGGGGTFDPATGLYFYDEFLSGSSATAPPQYVNFPGTGSSFATSTTYGQNSTAKVLGAWELTTGTNASNTGCAVMWGGGGTISPWSVVYNLGATLTLKSRIFLESTLPVTGQGYAFRFGLAQGLGTMYFSPPVQGFYFEYSPDNNSGQWRVAVGGASPAYTNTSTATAGDTAYWLEIDLNAAWTSATFKINGTTVATVSSGIPTTSGGVFWQLARGSTGANSYKAAIDAWMINYAVTR